MMIFSFNIRNRKTPKKKVWENDKTIITGMMWWTLQLKVFYCGALARRFHVSQQAVLSGQRIWKFKCWWDNEVMNVDLNEMVYFSCAQKQTYFCCTLESLECWPWLNVVLVKTYFCCASESLDVNHDFWQLTSAEPPPCSHLPQPSRPPISHRPWIKDTLIMPLMIRSQWSLWGWWVVMVVNDNSLQVEHSWFFNVHVAHSGLKVILGCLFFFFKAGP